SGNIKGRDCRDWEFMICRKINHPFSGCISGGGKTGNANPVSYESQEGYEYGIVDEPGLPMLEEALEKYPGLKFIGHSQPFWHEISQDAKPDLKSRMEWGRGPVREGGRLVCLMRNYKNLYADLSANSGGCAIMRDEKFGLQFLEEFQDRLMFGTPIW
ncbi:amidohydrolase, partial [Mediterraneibacter gnavus]